MAYTKLGRIRPVHKGAWSASAAYAALDMVRSGGVSYIANRDVPAGTPLTDGGYWAVVLDVSEVVEAAEGATETIRNVADTKANPLKAAAAGNPVQVHPDEGSLLKPVTELKPIQPGSGDPYPAGGGKNKIVRIAETQTINGITFTINPDESVTLNGTASSVTFLNYGKVALSGGTSYKLSTGINVTGVSAKFVNANLEAVTGAVNYTPTADDVDETIAIRLASGVSVTNLTVYPMLRLASDADGTYASPSNIRPISGRTGAELTRCGKNLVGCSVPSASSGLTITTEKNGFRISGTSTAAYHRNLFIGGILPAGTYTLSVRFKGSTTTNGGINVFCTAGIQHNVWKNGTLDGVYSKTFTLTEDVEVFSVNVACDSGMTLDVVVAEIQLELGSTATTYEPYQGDTFTLDFGQTVYGGVLDWNTGLLMVEWKGLTLNGSEPWALNNSVYYMAWLGINDYSGDTAVVCSHMKGVKSNEYATNMAIIGGGSVTLRNDAAFGNPATMTADDFKAYLAAQYAAGTPVQVAYKLATPVTIQLTPVQIPALEGANTLYTDGDGMTVDYNRSIADAYEELRNAIIAMGGYV